MLVSVEHAASRCNYQRHPCGTWGTSTGFASTVAGPRHRKRARTRLHIDGWCRRRLLHQRAARHLYRRRSKSALPEWGCRLRNACSGPGHSRQHCRCQCRLRRKVAARLDAHNVPVSNVSPSQMGMPDERESAMSIGRGPTSQCGSDDPGGHNPMASRGVRGSRGSRGRHMAARPRGRRPGRSTHRAGRSTASRRCTARRPWHPPMPRYWRGAAQSVYPPPSSPAWVTPLMTRDSALCAPSAPTERESSRADRTRRSDRDAVRLPSACSSVITSELLI
jgi:hypothetical protein